MTYHKIWKGLNLNAIDKSIRTKLSKDERKYIQLGQVTDIHLGIQIPWLFFITLPWLSANPMMPAHKMLTDYHLLVPFINLILWIVSVYYQDKILKRFISSQSSQNNSNDTTDKE